MNVGVTGGAAAGAALLVGASPTAAAIGALGSAAPAVWATIQDANLRRRERRKEAYLDEYVRSDDWLAGYLEGAAVDVEVAERALVLKGAAPEVQDVVIEGARALDEALSDAVVPSLARLTRHYVASAMCADAFFRGMRRLLSELDSDEFVALCELVSALLQVNEILALPVVELQHISTAVGLPPVVSYLRPNPSEVERVPLGNIPCALRLFHLLKVNGLARDSAAGFWGSISGPQVVVLDVGTVHRVQRIIAH